MGRLEKKKLINTLYCYGGERGIVIWGVINIFRLSFDKIDFDKGVCDVEMTPKATPCYISNDIFTSVFVEMEFGNMPLLTYIGRHM